MKHESNKTGFRLAIPFFVTLAVLTVVSFIIPLRPTQSQMEKRNLAEFPEFSVEALASGSYFDDITTWFSDTFPGRESWIAMSSNISSLHGYSEFAIAGDLPVLEQIPEEPQMPETPKTPEIPEETQSPALSEETESAEETTVPTEAGWGGVDAGDEENVELGNGTVIQIGDAAFNAVGFSKVYSEKYASTLSKFADYAAEKGVRTISAPAPTAVGILIEPEYLEMLGCSDQNATIQYFHGLMSDNVLKVDTFTPLVEHNDEYIYFRTDHHWTALGAYYAYEAICEAAGFDVVPLEAFEEFDQGEFEGSLYWKAPNRRKLRLDNVMAYIPPGDITCHVSSGMTGGKDAPLIADMTQRATNTKYLTFLGTDYALTTVTNNSIPDAPTCIVIKDSFGNALVPFLSQCYHKVYAIDYRKFHGSSLKSLIDTWDVDDVIFAPYLIATQANDGNKMFASKAGFQ